VFGGENLREIEFAKVQLNCFDTINISTRLTDVKSWSRAGSECNTTPVKTGLPSNVPICIARLAELFIRASQCTTFLQNFRYCRFYIAKRNYQRVKDFCGRHPCDFQHTQKPLKLQCVDA
jgi:hypothetical protein